MARFTVLLALPLVAALSACSGGQIPRTPANDGISPFNSALRGGATLASNSLSTGLIGDFSFKGSPDGAHPWAALLDVNGTLYGTTKAGGAKDRGTVFSVSPAGVETVIHSFGDGVDGHYPHAGLIDVDGTLYGTTAGGGTHHSGTVFSVTTSGEENVLYSFMGDDERHPNTDGAHPQGALIDVGGTLYGTTETGGTDNGGTVFSITPSGTENVIYSFKGGADGATPYADLIDVHGTFYSTTESGGAQNAGTVFSVTPSGTEKVIYSFQGGVTDGFFSRAGLINVDGTLYGTTFYGGPYDAGIAFSVTLSGKETILHTFGVGTDGVNPQGGLVYLNAKGTFYGTTFVGGTHGRGIVFGLTPAGAETVIRNFPGQPGGANPRAGLIDENGRLYGTTGSGGSCTEPRIGCGTVFHIDPAGL